MATGAATYCGECGALLTEPTDLPVDQRTPCPACGSLRRRHAMTLEVSTPTSVRLDAVQKRPGFPRKGRVVRKLRSGDDVSQATGERVRIERVVDVEHDRYVERVTAQDGAVLHECDEPLSEHRNRGSAKHRASPPKA